MKLFWKLSGQPGWAGGLLFAGLVLAGCSSTKPEPVFSDNPEPPAMTGSAAVPGGNAAVPEAEIDAARFRVGETVIVTFSGTADEIPSHEEPIKEDGSITLPLIGAIQAAGKTSGELQNQIHDLYVPKYYVRLTVTLKSQDRVYYVGGEVGHPGAQVYLGETTVTKAIQASGDLSNFANHHKIWLTRANGQRIKVNYDKAIVDPSKDPAVYPGDQINVSRRIF